VNLDWIVAANGEARRLLRADLTLFVDTPPETAVDRIKASRHRMDRYEDVGRLSRVRDAYLKSFESCVLGENIEMVNGDFDVEDVRSLIWKAVKKLDILSA
jgi:thymidylate kinase